MFDLMNGLFPLFFFGIFAFIIFNIIKSVSKWSYNNKQPVLIVPAQLTSKRFDVTRHNHNMNGHMHASNHTTYYATFQVESGDRMEFQVDGGEYGRLAEGDNGRLTFQGSRYLEFTRHG